MSASFNLPTPPSTNNLYSNVRGVGRVKTKEYNAWMVEAGWALKAAKPRPVAGNVDVQLRVPLDKRRDIDNFCKATLDILVRHKVIDDDRHVMRLEVEREDRNSKTIHVSVEPYEVRA